MGNSGQDTGQHAGKRHYHTLDGLRGLAAVAVVMFHLHSWMPAAWRPAGAYLAVDLFFVLSGFVLANAYSRRFDEGLSFKRFMLMRIIRLWPLYALALAMGTIPLLVKIASGTAGIGTLLAPVLGLFYIPSPTGWDAPLYWFNMPAWSLLFELVANALMCAAGPWLTNRVLTAIVGFSAVNLIFAAFAYGSLDVGHTLDGASVALARVGFSFFLGVLIFRMKPPRTTIGPWLLMAIVGLALAANPSEALRPLADLAAVFVFFPAVVWIGAASEPRQFAIRIFQFFATASYALYVIHLPALNLMFRPLEMILQMPREAFPVIVGIAIVTALVILAWLLDKADTVLRGRITAYLMPKRASSAALPA
jgi:peptidoglycan/LPS O-acetylase OafA/YrhL